MIRLLRRRRLQLTAAVTVFLVLAGGSGATAYWSGQAQLQAQAGAASMGLELQLLPTPATSPLAVAYTAQSRVAAGAVTIRNTGSRAASSALSITAEAASSPQLPASVSVAVAAVAAAADCTPQRVLSAPTVRTLSTAATSFPISGSVAAGAMTILCVQTTLQQDAASPSAAQSMQLAIGAKLTYADAVGWSMSSPVLRVAQSVAAVASAPAFHDYARYTIKHQGFCVERPGSSVARSASCGWDSGWRVIAAAPGTFNILAANNAVSDRSKAPRWTSVQPGTSALQVSNPNASGRQQWRITAAGAATYRIESVSNPGYCAAIGDGLYNANDTNPRRVVLALCDAASADQDFAFEAVGNPLPADQQLSCVADGWNATLALAQAPVSYEAEIEYRAFISRAATPDVRTALPTSASGYDPIFRIASANTGLKVFADGGGVGNARIYVEQRIAQSAWVPIASAQVRTTQSPSLQIWCGWQ